MGRGLQVRGGTVGHDGPPPAWPLSRRRPLSRRSDLDTAERGRASRQRELLRRFAASSAPTPVVPSSRLFLSRIRRPLPVPPGWSRRCAAKRSPTMSFLGGRRHRHAVLSVPQFGLLEKNIGPDFPFGGSQVLYIVEVPGSGSAGGRIGGCGDGRSWNSGSSAGAAGTGDLGGLAGLSAAAEKASRPAPPPAPSPTNSLETRQERSRVSNVGVDPARTLPRAHSRRSAALAGPDRSPRVALGTGSLVERWRRRCKTVRSRNSPAIAVVSPANSFAPSSTAACPAIDGHPRAEADAALIPT